MQFENNRVVKLLRWITPRVNKTAWRRLSEDSLKLDSCLQGCYCQKEHCTLACSPDCNLHCQNERKDRERWLNDFTYVRRFEPPCVKAVNWQKNWVMDRKGRLRGPYTHEAWTRYGWWALDTFHETISDKRVYWHQLYFRNENDYYGGSYNHFYPIHMVMIQKLQGLEEQHRATNNLSRGFDVYQNIMPIDQKDAVKIRNAGRLFTTPAPHFENLRQYHKLKLRPLEADLIEWEKNDKKAKTKFVKKNAKKVRNWAPDPEGENLSPAEAQEQADRRCDLWYPKNRNVPLMIPRNSEKIIPPAFPTKKELENKYFAFNIKTIEHWLKTGAIYMLKKDEIPDLIVPAVYANMEKKGRMCVDGGWIKQIEAYSVKCHLEDLPKALLALKLKIKLTKCDDKRGFHLFMISKEGRKLTAFGLFDENFEYRVAAFGIPGSPGEFQLVNMVAVNYGRFFGLDWLCYLDDRLMMDFDSSIPRRFGQLQPQNAIRGLLLIIAGGGFISLDKSELIPTTKIQFLGMELDTTKGTIAVPEEKWIKFVKILRIRTLGSE